MRHYELTYLISPELSEEEVKTFSQGISGFITEQEGKIERTTRPLRKKLDSPINKATEAFLITSDFHLEPEKLEILEKKLKSESRILRYIILTKRIPRVELLPKPGVPEEKIEGTKEPVILQPKTEKVELKDIDKKIEEILHE